MFGVLNEKSIYGDIDLHSALDRHRRRTPRTHIGNGDWLSLHSYLKKISTESKNK